MSDKLLDKVRKPFNLYDKRNTKIGHGQYYRDGNVQVYMQPDNAALQIQLADVLLIENVATFRWAHAERPKSLSKRKRDMYAYRKARVLYAGYQVFRTGLYEDSKPTEQVWQVNDPLGVPFSKFYQHEAKAVSAAVRHVKDLIDRADWDDISPIEQQTVDRYLNYKETRP